MVRQLWTVGIHEIFVDGSFAEDKEHPNDIDGYFVCDMRLLVSGALERELNQLDPFKVWTWNPISRRPYRGSPKAQLPMWHHYRLSSTRTSANSAVSKTSTEMTLSFRLLFGCRGGTDNPVASSKSEEPHDSQ